jgi:hypothetical protein
LSMSMTVKDRAEARRKSEEFPQVGDFVEVVTGRTGNKGDFGILTDLGGRRRGGGFEVKTLYNKNGDRVSARRLKLDDDEFKPAAVRPEGQWEVGDWFEIDTVLLPKGTKIQMMARTAMNQEDGVVFFQIRDIREEGIWAVSPAGSSDNRIFLPEGTIKRARTIHYRKGDSFEWQHLEVIGLASEGSLICEHAGGSRGIKCPGRKVRKLTPLRVGNWTLEEEARVEADKEEEVMAEQQIPYPSCPSCHPSQKGQWVWVRADAREKSSPIYGWIPEMDRLLRTPREVVCIWEDPRAVGSVVVRVGTARQGSGTVRLTGDSVEPYRFQDGDKVRARVDWRDFFKGGRWVGSSGVVAGHIPENIVDSLMTVVDGVEEGDCCLVRDESDAAWLFPHAALKLMEWNVKPSMESATKQQQEQEQEQQAAEAAQRGQEREMETADRIFSMVTMDLKEGAKDAGAAELDVRIVELVESKFKDSYPEALKTEMGRAFARYALPLLIQELAMSGASPLSRTQLEAVCGVCARARRTAARDAFQPYLSAMMIIMMEMVKLAPAVVEKDRETKKQEEGE